MLDTAGRSTVSLKSFELAAASEHPEAPPVMSPQVQVQEVIWAGLLSVMVEAGASLGPALLTTIV